MSLGGGELLVILLAVFLLFGAEKMPEILRGVSKGMKEFRKVSDDIKREFNESTEDIRNDINDVTADVRRNAAEANKNIHSYLNESEVAKDIKNIDNEIKDTDKHLEG